MPEGGQQPVPEPDRNGLAIPIHHYSRWREWFVNHPKQDLVILCGATILVALFIAGSILVRGTGFLVPRTHYQQVYTLVNDKISQHGAIIINLPNGVDAAEAVSHVSFNPEIQGNWVDSELNDAIVYKPSEDLTIGRHYEVALDTGKGTIRKDFQVDQDPVVQNIFPDNKVPADLSSAITIVFNRPIVPLTTLSELESKDIPVTITPATPGRFKWISTRTLQFIPDTTLFGSAHYSVDLGRGLISTDGLEVPTKSYGFTTKALALNSVSEGIITYNAPIHFRFNQPVDLEKTQHEISVVDQTNGGRAVEFVASYGTREVWDQAGRRYQTVQDNSIIDVVPKNSLRGHSNAWEFSTNYAASIRTVYPVGGDIALKGAAITGPAVQASVQTTSVLEQTTVQSESTPLASPELFDPSGTVTYTFYENIDIGRSTIEAKGLKSVVYGTKCVDQGPNTYPDPTTCTKEENHKALILTFDPGAFQRGETVRVSFTKLTNQDGFVINAQPIVEELHVYPALKILSSTPASGSASASVSDLVICTNVPLDPMDAKTFKQNFHANAYMVFGRWDNPYQENPNSWEKPKPCDDGAYVNRIHYGILPQTQYVITANVADVFGQRADLNVNILSGAAPKFYLRFQNLQKIYNVTTPDHTTLTYSTENFDYVDMQICRLAPEDMVKLLARSPATTVTSGTEDLPCTKVVSDRIALKSDQWVNQYFQVNVSKYFTDPKGQYVLSFTHPLYQDEKGTQLYARTYLSVTNLASVANRVQWTSYDYLPDVPDMTPTDTRGGVYWLSRIHTLDPEAGAQIAVYHREGGRWDGEVTLAKTATTDDRGIAEFPLIGDVVGAAITSGDDTAIISSWADMLQGTQWAGTGHQDERIYLYSDRPIYRPGQTVYLKGLFRLNYDGMYHIFRDAPLTITVSDSRGATVLEQKVQISAYGTFSANVALPSNAALGTYYVSTSGYGYATFDVEEYKAAAFQADATADKDEYVAGDTALVSVIGKYYFGAPVSGGSLQYTITAQNYYFDRYQDEYFNFGGDWYSCYDCGYGDTYLKSGETVLDANGEAQVSIPLTFKDLFKGGNGDQSKIFVLHGTVKDAQGKTVSFQQSFIVHRGDYYLGVKADPSFVPTKKPFSLRVKTVDTKGKAVSKSGIDVTINKVSWDSYKRQEVDGGYYNRPSRTLTPVTTRHISTDFAGNFSDQITLNDPGEYEIDAVGHDSRGNTLKSVASVYAYGAGQVDVQETNNATLNMTAEKKDLKVGDTARFIIQNPYPHARALVSIERGRIFTYEVVDINQSVFEYEFPITEEYAPNIYASVVLLSPDPAVKFGQLEFTVDKKAKELQIQLRTDKPAYLPGETVRLTVTTLNAAGKPVPADVSLSVADLSVLALAGNPKKDPLVFFYNGFPLTVAAETNIKNLLEETPIPTGTKGGDGGNAADLATKKRGEFKDTAFWQADVITNNSGTASVSFTLPDNLTKWQIESVGITKDTRVGAARSEILAQKQVMTIPLIPRFIVPGDHFQVGAQIFNQSQSNQTLTVAVESPTLVLSGARSVQKTVKAGEHIAVYFDAEAPLSAESGSHTVTISAKNSDFNDTVEQTIPITPNTAAEYTATAGSSEAESATEYLYLPDSVLKDRGGLTIRTSATLAVYLSDAITYLFQYPYGCSEQLASRLSSMVIAKKALAVPNVGSGGLPKVQFDGKEYTVDDAVSIGLAKIYDSQNPDGGYAYYKGMVSDPYLTLSVVDSLLTVKDGGYAVRSGAIAEAVDYLNTEIGYFTKQGDTDSLAYLAYVLARAGQSQSANGIIARLPGLYTSEHFSSAALGYVALAFIDMPASQTQKDGIFAALENRVDIDSRGAYVKTNPDQLAWQLYETPEKDTALLIKALARDTRSYAETDNLIRWLIASRAHDGSWGSTNTTLAALDALSDYLNWKKETQSEFTLETLLDGASVQKTAFGHDNILATIEKFIPTSDISLGTLHSLTFQKSAASSAANRFYYDLSLQYYLPIDQIAPRDEGFTVMRDFYRLTDSKNSKPLTTAKVGDVVRGVITIVSPKERHNVSIEDFVPAGFELVNFNLATEDESNVSQGLGAATSSMRYLAAASEASSPNLSRWWKSAVARVLAILGKGGVGAAVTGGIVDPSIMYEVLYPSYTEMHDDRLMLFVQDLRPGTYTYVYYARATTPGTFARLPATASELYFPENFGRTGGSSFSVSQ